METKNKIIISFIIITVIYGIGLAGFNFAQALPTNQMNVSAYLADGQGKEITNGDYDVRFSIYQIDRTTRDAYPSDADSGSRIWQETQKVKVINGIISTYLGISTPIPATLNFNDGDYYLGIRIGQDSEMVPRKKLSAIPIAINSLFLRGATTGTASGNIPLLGAGGKLDTNIIPDITSVGIVSVGTWEGDMLAAGFGGTGLTSYSTGDTLYASSKNKLAALAIGTSGQYLTVSGGLPAWGDLVTHDIITLAGAYDYLTLIDQEITLNQINLTTDVTGTLPIASGGTNASTIGDAGSLAYSTGTAYGFSAAGAGGEVLLSGGAGAPVWGAVTGGVIAPNSLDFTEFSNAMTLDADTTIDTNSNDFSIIGTLSVNNLSADTLTISGEATIGMLGLSVSVSSSLIPSDPGLNLGSATNHWADLYVDNLSVGGSDMSGTTSEYFTINTDAVAEETMGLRFYRGSVPNGYAALVYTAASQDFSLYQKESDAILADLNIDNLSAAGSGDNYFAGNVGIGDTSPDTLLDILSSAAANTQLTITNTNAGDYDTRVGFQLVEGTNLFTMGVDDSDSDKFKISTTGLGTSDRLVIDSSGKVGIGISPSYTLDVNGNFRASLSLTAGINVETLSDNKTLTPGTDKMYQYLDPNGVNRTITLATATASAGDRFTIRHNGVYNSSFSLIIQGPGLLDIIFAGSIKEFIFNGTNWVSGGIGTGENTDSKGNVGIGYRTSAYTYGTGIGYYVDAFSNGTAIGYTALGYTNGAAVGYDARGYTSGAAVGYSARGQTSGAAVGYGANGYTNGAAVGYGVNGVISGAAVGYSANGSSYGAAVGSEARGLRYGAALGYQAGYSIDINANRYNVLVGAYSGYRLTTGTGNIITGYQSGYDATYSPTTGSKNILIGYQAGTPANATANFLNIGNLIFATGVNTATGIGISTGNVGIGDTSPDQLLEVMSSAAASTQLTVSNTNAGDYDPQIGLELVDGTNLFTMGVDDSDSDKFKISTTGLGTNDRFTIDSSGNITIPDLSTNGVVIVSSGTLDSEAQLALTRGGTGADLTAVQGGIVYSTDTALAISVAGTTGQALISGGTGTPTWFAPTAGSVLFAGAGGILAQDNAGLFWNSTDNYLGIGTAVPEVALHIGTESPASITSANSAFIQGELEVGETIYLGPLEFPADAGVVSWVDLPVVSAVDNTLESYTAYLDGNAMLTIYGLATGSGTADNLGVGIGTATPTALLDVSDVISNITTGKALNIASAGTGLTSGSLLYVSSATTGAVATSGIVSLNATGNYTSTSNVGLLNIAANSTAAGTIENITGNALTTGNALRVSSTGTGLTSGSLLYLTSATTGAVATNGIVSLNASGNYTSTSNIGLLSVLANSTNAGTIQNIQGNALTTGNALYISTSSAGLTTGNLLALSSTGAATGFTGALANISFAGNNAGNMGQLLKVTQSAGANLTTPLMVTNLGAGISFRVNDETGDADTTPFVIDASGNVGIGTTSPGATLEVLSANYPVGKFVRSSSAVTGMYGSMGMWSKTSADMTDGFGSAVVINIQDGGADNPIAYFGAQRDGDDYKGKWIFGNYGGAGGASPSEKMVINWSGNVGIGDTGPDQLLEILSSGAANTQLSIGNTNAGDYDPQIGFELADGTNTFTLGVDDSDSDKFKISTTGLGTSDRLVIDSNGNVGINKSSPSYRLDVATSTANDRGINIAQTATTGTNYGAYSSASGNGATANYGGMFAASGATDNYSGYFYTNPGVGQTGYGAYGFGFGANGSTTYGLYSHCFSLGTCYGLKINMESAGEGASGIDITQIAAIASATTYGINLGGITGTAASSNNYGINIGTINSTGTADYGLHISQPAGATHDAALVIGTVATAAGDWALYSSSTANSYFAGNVGIGTTDPGGGTGTSILSLYNSADPTALANTTHLYSSAGEGYWMDAAGNAALQTPHDLQTGKWIFSSTNVNTERTLRVEMEDLTKSLDTILGGGYVFENGEPYYQGENMITGLNTQLSEQGTVISELTTNNQQLTTDISGLSLKTSKNITTIEELQESIDDNLATLDSVISNQQLAIGEIKNQITNYQLRTATMEDLMAELQNQMDELKQLTNQELNLAQIDANKTDIDYLKLVLGLDRAENGSLNLLGNLEADEVVAGAFTVKITDEEKKTIGEAEIYAIDEDANSDGKDDKYNTDGKYVEVETKAVTETAKIFTSFSDDPGSTSWVEKVKNKNTGDYTGFKIMLSTSVAKDVKVSWWIVEEK